MHRIDPVSIQQNIPYRSLCTQGRGYHGFDIAYCWACPMCGCHVSATGDEHATRDEIATDARCGICRKQAVLTQKEEEPRE